mmetsp:Transcript_47817/g.104089  ORF Transcript_47817/g.104089 Transcript_47817/m.104089 type:complete len:263 (+) Transcript_47817:118-906(+)
MQNLSGQNQKDARQQSPRPLMPEMSSSLLESLRQMLRSYRGIVNALKPSQCRSSRSLCSCSLPSHRDEVDAVAVAASIRDVVAEVRAVNRDTFAVGKATDILPDNLGVSEGRPAMDFGLLLERLKRATPRSDEEGLARHRIIVSRLLGAVDLLEKGGSLKVAAVLCEVAIVGANAVGCVPVNVPTQLLLHRVRAGPMGLFLHDVLGATDGVLGLGRGSLRNRGDCRCRESRRASTVDLRSQGRLGAPLPLPPRQTDCSNEQQ